MGRGGGAGSSAEAELSSSLAPDSAIFNAIRVRRVSVARPTDNSAFHRPRFLPPFLPDDGGARVAGPVRLAHPIVPGSYDPQPVPPRRLGSARSVSPYTPRGEWTWGTRMREE